MNDFTRREIELLCLNLWVCDQTQELFYKLIFMLLNYSEPDSKEALFKVATTSCSKCGTIQ
jgi:hypothetical protein